MEKLVARLAELGFRTEALNFCERLRSVPGLFDLYLKLTAETPGQN